jgi:sortase (surface protein transpeptidase)
MIKLIFELFLLYLLYKFIFEFIIPVYQTTKQVKRKMHEMQEAMKNQQNNNHHQQSKTSSAPNPSENSEYIDYEEVK